MYRLIDEKPCANVATVVVIADLQAMPIAAIQLAAARRHMSFAIFLPSGTEAEADKGEVFVQSGERPRGAHRFYVYDKRAPPSNSTLSGICERVHFHNFGGATAGMTAGLKA